MVEGPIDQPQNWGTMALAFIIWGVHFSGVYAGELIFPDNPAARWTAAAVTVAALAALAWIWRRLGDRRSTFATLAIALATGGVIYDALPPLLVW